MWQRTAQRRQIFRAGLIGLLACAATTLAWGNKLAGPEKRTALVIGNSAYKLSPLKNPVNDAQAVAATLKGLGFDVLLRENTTFKDLLEAMRLFSLRSQDAEVRLVFYAGHGIQVKGRNYLLPIDTVLQSEEEAASKAADVNQLLERMSQAKEGMNVVILDACRNNPFAGNDVVLPDGRRMRYRSLLPGGLAKVDPPLGTLIAFSTAPGGVALDNPNAKNSVYTQHLIANMQIAGLPIEQVFKRVRAGVAQETGRMQVPWESSSIMNDFCFKTANGGSCVMGASGVDLHGVKIGR
ncbi:MAG: caspase domain-containing protein [Burkholderiales bacterium]